MTRSDCDIQVSYGERFGEIEIAGGAAELEVFASMIDLGDGLIATTVGVDPTPFDRFISVIEVSRAPTGGVTILVSGDTLSLKGSSDALGHLAKNIRDFGREGRPGEHFHVDYFPGHSYLEPSGASIIFRLEGGGGDMSG